MKKKEPPTARSQAIACLSAWAGSGQPIQAFAETMVHDSDLSSENRQLAMMLIMGVLRSQGRIDMILCRFSKTSLAKMKPLTLAALRVGTLQICFLDRIPESAAVNETVAALKKMHQPRWLLGFVNATLRNIARSNKQPLSLPEAIAAEFDHPAWLTERWRKNFGAAKTAEICRINSIEPRLCLHVNPLRSNQEQMARQLATQGIKAFPGRHAPDSLIVHDRCSTVGALPGFSEGLLQVQDQAAQLACHLLGPFQEAGRYLDACAGLGGKTCNLASLLPPNALLQAVEPDNRRFRLLQENVQRQQFQERIRIFHGELSAFAATLPPSFDGVLIDAPCSGTGVIRRHPDIRWNRRPDDLAAFQSKQLSLLNQAAELLSLDGVLVYATCSIEPEENQQVVEQFLASHLDFRLADCRSVLPTAVELIDEQGFFAPLPTEEIDGFFAARLIRKKSTPESIAQRTN